MAEKYLKPLCREFGELTNANGVCRNGSVANTGVPDLLNNCRSGGVASGAGCGFGQVPSTNACSIGQIAQYFGCAAGLDAVAPCSSGDGVV